MYTTRTGMLTHEEGQFLLDALPLDLGADEVLDARAAFDHDGDGALESNRDELLGLVEAGEPVTVEHQAGAAPLRVTKIGIERF